MSRLNSIKKRFQSFDITLIVLTIMLSIFGLVMVYSASIYSTIERYNKVDSYFFDKQLVALILGIIVFLFVSNINYNLYKNTFLQVFAIITTFVLLILVETLGTNIGNSQRWLYVGPISIQPTEICKIVIIFYMAAVFHKKQRYIDELNRSLVPPVIILMLMVFFLYLQPDLGSAIIVFAIGACITICSGMNWKKISVMIAICALLGGLGLFLIDKYPILSENKMQRINGYRDPFGTGQKDGYQLVNSLLALGAGKMNGVGFGESVQKFGYLPESHTDAIIAIIGEEFGFIGVVAVLFAIGTIVLKGIVVGKNCTDPFGSMVAVGIASMIGLQAFINLGGMIGIMPITGVTLPLISYGGNSLLITFASLGVLVNISMQTELKRQDK